MKSYTILIMAVCMCGCASQQGRVAIADLDFRKPEQITAYAREAEAPYKDWTSHTAVEASTKDNVKAESLPTWWDMFLDALTKLECRITIFQLEWTDHTRNNNAQLLNN